MAAPNSFEFSSFKFVGRAAVSAKPLGRALKGKMWNSRPRLFFPTFAPWRLCVRLIIPFSKGRAGDNALLPDFLHDGFGQDEVARLPQMAGIGKMGGEVGNLG